MYAQAGVSRAHHPQAKQRDSENQEDSSEAVGSVLLQQPAFVKEHSDLRSLQPSNEMQQDSSPHHTYFSISITT